MSEDEQLTKVVVDLPNHWGTGGEALWALPLGEDLYELRNTPFYAYGLSFRDVVRAIPPDPEKKPFVRELVRAGGHRTLRVIFTDRMEEEDRPGLLEELNALNASFEGGSSSYYAIDVEPEGDYDAVRARLDAWEAEGILNYETCEPRVPGSFDDRPPDDD